MISARLGFGARIPPFVQYLPGIFLVALTAASAYGLRQVPVLAGVSPMIAAIVIGMLFAQFVGVPERAGPGIALAGRKVLRLAVALLGLQITFAQLAAVGMPGLISAALCLVLTFVFTVMAGRLLGVAPGLAILIGGGTAVCGASAIAAINTTAKAGDDNVAYAVACVTLFGTVAMVAYPWLNHFAGLDAAAYGQWVGLSVHEVAQVVGAGYREGVLSGEVAVMVKLARVVMLAPLVLFLAVAASRSRTGSRAVPMAAMPTFIVGFLCLVALNSFNVVPELLKNGVTHMTPILLTMALGALGLGTRVSKICEKGLRPLALAALSFIFIATLSLLLVKIGS